MRVRKELCLQPPLELDQLQNWDIAGLVSENEYIQLTPDEPVSFGYICSNNQVEKGNNWRVNFTFKIQTSNKTEIGEGLAFWYTENPIYPGIAMGAHSQFHGLGVFIDTYPNAQKKHKKFPHVFYLINPGNINYEQAQDGGEKAISGCAIEDPIYNTKESIKASVEYVDGIVRFSINSKECFIAKTDLLDFDGHISLSAGTAAAFASYRIVSLETFTEESTKYSSNDENLHFFMFCFITASAAFVMLTRFLIKLKRNID